MTDKEKSICYKRVVLKISGEALIGKNECCNINADFIKEIGKAIKELVELKVQVGIVVGGGNFFRGAKLCNPLLSRITGDHLGMLGTMLNAIAMQDVFTRLEIPVKVVSALPITGLIEAYSHKNVLEYLKNHVVVFAGGIGSPLVTTDTALCLRGIEIDADLLLKATNVDGVYAGDPKKDPNLELYKNLTYDEALSKKLRVMDLTAFCLGRDYKMKLRVFNIYKKGALLRIIQGEDEGTFIE